MKKAGLQFLEKHDPAWRKAIVEKQNTLNVYPASDPNYQIMEHILCGGIEAGPERDIILHAVRLAYLNGLEAGRSTK